MYVLWVALLAEGVDRNNGTVLTVIGYYVALLAEGVDRNFAMMGGGLWGNRSPSSQRAWIEMCTR